MKGQYRKKWILMLRWAAIIVTSYLILFGGGRVTDLQLGHLLIIGYILTNVILTFLPNAWFSNTKLFYSLVLIDTGIVTIGMYLSEKLTTDFYLVFFLIIIFASMSRNFKLLMAIGGVTALLYGFLIYSWGLFTLEDSVSYTLRIPFIFIMTAFYGYIIETFTREKNRELAFSEDKYRSLFENANEGILILENPQYKIVDVNREVEHVTGFTREELRQKKMIDLFEHEGIEKASKHFEEVSVKEEGRADFLSLIKKDGSAVEVDLSTKRIVLGEETFFQSIFRDLTEQRRLEKKIRESKRNLEAIFDGIRDQLSLLAPDYEILRVNKAVSENYQMPYIELIGKKCYEAYYQRNLPCEKCPVSMTIQTQQPSVSIMRMADTTLRVFSYPILDENGNLASVIEYIQDITEEEQLQEQLIQSEKLAGIGILASGAAHEINNPLSGIIGITEIALEEEDPSKNKDYLTDILRCSQRISEIVNGLRSYSRAAKKGELCPVDINEILENSLKMVQLATKTASVKVVKNLQPIEKIEANPGEIQQVFTNLITNAFQAMNRNEGILTLSTQWLKNLVEIRVCDNGVGISPKYINKIFDPFFTTKDPGEGTGLGLNIVYRIVTKYEGKIEVQSKEGVGATFTVRFPIRKDR